MTNYTTQLISLSSVLSLDDLMILLNNQYRIKCKQESKNSKQAPQQKKTTFIST